MMGYHVQPPMPDRTQIVIYISRLARNSLIIRLFFMCLFFVQAVLYAPKIWNVNFILRLPL